MHITPDAIVYLSWHGMHLNATIVFTWLVMAIIVGVSIVVTRRLVADGPISTIQTILESIVLTMHAEIKNITRLDPEPYLPFLGALFLLISVSNLLSVVPFYHPPTGSLSTTSALAFCIFIAVPSYGIARQGAWGYLKTFADPTPIMIPFHILGNFSRILALAVRLFGNVLSGTLVGGVLLSLVPFFFPVVMSVLELLIGQIQAYIFTVLSTVFIASAMQVEHETLEKAIHQK
jgi:F-type H+-transporting ATPase subunit a